MNIIILLLLGLLLKLPMFLYPHAPLVQGNEGFFYQGILAFLTKKFGSQSFIFPVMAFLLLFIQSFLLTSFVNEQRMMARSNYFPGMAYMLVTSLFPDWNYFSAPLLVNTILIVILSSLFKSYNKENAKGGIYNTGLALGIATFIFFPAISFILWVLMSLAVMRPFRLNEWILCILGVTTPYYFFGIYLFITDQWSWHNLIPEISMGVPLLKQSAWLAGSTFLLILPFLAGGFYVQDNLRRMLIQMRKGWSLILLYLLGAIIIPFINSNAGFSNWVLVTIPFAAFHACTYFYAKRKIVALLLFWMTVVFVLSYQYLGPGW